MQTIQDLLAMYPKGTVKSVECLYNVESTINLFTKGKRYNVKGVGVECDKGILLRRTESKFGKPEFHDFRMLPKEHKQIVNPHMIDGKAPPLVTGFVPKSGKQKDSTQDSTPEDSGGSCDYYKVHITNPTSEQDIPRGVVYIAECNDIIEALKMTYAEANMFKEIWRSAAARTLGKLKAGHSEARGSEKIVFFAERNRIQKGGRK